MAWEEKGGRGAPRAPGTRRARPFGPSGNPDDLSVPENQDDGSCGTSDAVLSGTAVNKGFSGALLALLSAFACCFAVAVLVGVYGAGQDGSFPGLGNSKGTALEGTAPGSAVSESATWENYPAVEATTAAGDGILDAAPYLADEVLVRVREGCAAGEVEARLRALGLFEVTGVTAGELTSGFLQLRLANGVSVPQAVRALEEAAGQNGESVLLGAEPNYVLYADGVAGASAFPLAGGVSAQAILTDDPYVADGTLWNLDAIGVYDAWDEARAEGRVTVAVVDEGFTASHEDLAANVKDTRWIAASESADATDVSGRAAHGTHVAGIAAAVADNGKGVAGVSYNAQLMLLKIADSRGNMSAADLTRAIDYVCEYAAAHPQDALRVMNLSVGTYSAEEPEMSGVLYDAIARAREAGIVTVCAACNASRYSTESGTKSVSVPFYAFPADYDNVVSVIALRQSDEVEGGVVRLASSNYNMEGQRAKDVSAPGNDIWSTYTDPLYSNAKSGTSMASPHVAGVLALMFAANPELSADNAVGLLRSTAQDVRYENGDEVAGEGWDRYTGYGMANAPAAVEMAEAAAYLGGDEHLLVGESAACQLPVQTASRELAWAWASSDEGVASVVQVAGDEGGSGGGAVMSEVAVKCLSPGVAKITATSGAHALSKTVTVYGEPVITGAAELEVGADAEYAVDAGAEGDWEWSSSDASVLAIASDAAGEEGASASDDAASEGVSEAGASDSGAAASADAADAAGAAESSRCEVRAVGAGEAYLTATLKANAAITASVRVEVAAVLAPAGEDAAAGAEEASSGAAETGASEVAGDAAPEPSWSGASRLPVGASAAYTVSNGRMAVLSGSANATLSGTKLVGKKAGKVKLALLDANGKRCAAKTVRVYKLSGKWVLASAAKASLALDVRNASKKDGAKLVAWKKAAAGTRRSQLFKFSALASGKYAIVSVNSHKLVRVLGKARANGALVGQKGTAAAKSAQWKLQVDALDRVSFVNVRSGKALDVKASSVKKGGKIAQKKLSGRKTQKWVLQKV